MRGRVLTALVHPGYRAVGATVLVALAAWVALPPGAHAPVPVRQVPPTSVVVVRHSEPPIQSMHDQIVISTSTNLTDAASAFSSNTGRFYCIANLPDVPLSTPITWEWQRVLGSNTSDLFAPITFTYPTVIRYGYADGPYQAGHYRCIVRAKAKLIGSADFTIRTS